VTVFGSHWDEDFGYYRWKSRSEFHNHVLGNVEDENWKIGGIWLVGNVNFAYWI
jgi:hypothetical protein